MSLGQKYARLCVPCPRKHIHPASLLNTIPPPLQQFQIPHQTGGLAGDVDHPLRPDIGTDLLQGPGVDTVPGRIQDHQLWPVCETVKNLQHIPGDELAVVQTIKGRILPGSLHCLLHNLHSHYLIRHWSQHLGDGAGSTVQIKKHPAFRLPHVIPHCLIEHLRAGGIGLEKGEGCDPELKSQKLLKEIIPSVKNLRPIALDHIRQTIVSDMQDSGKFSH